jgi:hypothetical protein
VASTRLQQRVHLRVTSMFEKEGFVPVASSSTSCARTQERRTWRASGDAEARLRNVHSQRRLSGMCPSSATQDASGRSSQRFACVWLRGFWLALSSFRGAVDFGLSHVSKE